MYTCPARHARIFLPPSQSHITERHGLHRNSLSGWYDASWDCPVEVQLLAIWKNQNILQELYQISLFRVRPEGAKHCHQRKEYKVALWLVPAGLSSLWRVKVKKMEADLLKCYSSLSLGKPCTIAWESWHPVTLVNMYVSTEKRNANSVGVKSCVE